jgi:hypothetical protein
MKTLPHHSPVRGGSLQEEFNASDRLPLDEKSGPE